MRLRITQRHNFRMGSGAALRVSKAQYFTGRIDQHGSDCRVRWTHCARHQCLRMAGLHETVQVMPIIPVEASAPTIRLLKPTVPRLVRPQGFQSYYSALMSQSRNNFRAQGFSLIEVLISMLILAFGVLSMGGLQLASLRSSQSAASFSTAATLAKDYTEMMRSNLSMSNITSTVAGVNPYLFDTANSASFTASPLSGAALCQGAACTGAQISTLHVADWAERVTTQLAAGRAVICRDPAPRNANGTYRWGCGTNDGTEVTVKLGWIDRRDREERGITSTISLTPLNPQLVMGGLTGFAE